MSKLLKEFLTFRLKKEEFAIAIDRVQEIRGWQTPNPLPNVPSFVKGVIDIRGSVVPIIDLRERFKLPTDFSATTVVIVVNVITQNSERIVGLVVDAVSDVQQFDLNNLQAPPDISNTIDSQYIQGLTTIFDQNQKDAQNNESMDISEAKSNKGKMVIVIDLDKLASEGLIEQITQGEEDGLPMRNG
ncbi:MAG: chemotaxis protein CheW [Piscirickettsiaceae bacterium CG_4_9_14_3_um_filter_43_564]|nr:chemotaxis protein CheW [Thiomicrospira sp.]OIP94968.1 MAG: chemotaxis protein CheW [Thiomicrospira sp. CG2_30_44_34]PIQ04969.1 MAG: chemotaxis protein CheW [Piscirickettsiaceae bacterium CG18_big_fil_WC_8_21_14_2_50_44_103]PIU38243.1 MAG: chemotaxis protein CheW [Piscirickettsiaceae bacterium CG07_land_8_20_14_0_80_44_28]PIW57307.1 MAG: chemotaxis protein CheW [Piscirickettsiaceae bacterium CG12_big_fil_rev_8_21_14_0_65_44_934]PIW76939.1 MAG: chemotaxis protein CheW [Piscirickettsiaceae ba